MSHQSQVQLIHTWKAEICINCNDGTIYNCNINIRNIIIIINNKQEQHCCRLNLFMYV